MIGGLGTTGNGPLELRRGDSSDLRTGWLDRDGFVRGRNGLTHVEVGFDHEKARCRIHSNGASVWPQP